MHLQRVRTEGKEYFDQKHRLRETGLNEGDLVLLHDTGRFRSREVTNKLGQMARTIPNFRGQLS